MGQRSVAIAGCGVCGLATARLLARAGERVVLFERFDAPRPLGFGLMIQPTGLAVLARLGLADRVRREAARINRLSGMAEGRVVLDVSYGAMTRGDRFGIGIHRASLFAALHDAVLLQGIEIRTGHTVVGSRLEGSKRALLFEDGSASEDFDLLIDGLGTRSLLAPPIGYELAYGALWASLDWPEGCGLDVHTLSQRYRRSSVMAGVLPLGTGGGPSAKAAFFWSLKGKDLAAWHEAKADAKPARLRRRRSTGRISTLMP
jgi:2-polyprenyl-6-methoxyphenol hydroxylase-like FAD-dependent oxidoreductase